MVTSGGTGLTPMEAVGILRSHVTNYAAPAVSMKGVERSEAASLCWRDDLSRVHS